MKRSNINKGTKKLAIFLAVMFAYFAPKFAIAECNFDSSPIHKHCEYFAPDGESAEALCLEQAAILAAEGYQALGCFGSTYKTSSGWYTQTPDYNRKFPYQFISVRYDVVCPDGSQVDPVTGICNPVDPEDKAAKDDGDCTNNTDNPCNVATGNKHKSQTDVSGNTLSFTRSYNSRNLVDLGLGKGWRSGYQKRLIVSGDSLTLASGTGRGEPWTKTGGIWSGDADSDFIITEDASGFTVTKQNDDVEQYDTSGNLVSETDAQGNTTSYAYDVDNQLITVTNQYGHTLSFTYDANNHLETVTDASGDVYAYEYDANDNLTTVTFPDTTPGDSNDNPRKIYHYENIDFPNHLTGITDENGDRYQSYAYDVAGWAIQSEKALTSNAVGQERVDLSFDEPNNQTMVTDAIGTQELWTFQENLGAHQLLSKINQTDNKGITKTYDANNNVLSETDAEGRVTTYTYNATNQKTSMTEASGTPEARTTTYEYVNADIDLITKVSKPSVHTGSIKDTITTYDANLNVTSVTINGFTQSGDAVTRSTSYQYDSLGKVTQIDGPRTDVSDITTFTYFDCATGSECGQLESVTNAAGHATNYDSYDANGRLTQSTDANGTVTTYSYHPRGWLLSMVQTPTQGLARTTTYTYDGLGQLLTTTSPDGIVLTYTYDAAHDLTSITDNLGNSVEYSYDAKGNRTEENTYDPDNTLVRTLTTQYDIRNFIQSINSAGSITQMVNDAVGNLNQQTDPNVNPSTQNSYDGLYRLQQTIDALTNNTNYQYNVADQLTQVQAPNGVTTRYEYDDLGNLLQETSPDRGTMTYMHDDAGNVLSINDARGVTASYAYDSLNRLTGVSYPDTSENITYTYDEQLAGDPASNVCGISIGRLCQITDPSGQTNYEYDAWGNVLTETKQEAPQQSDTNQNTQSYITQYSYDEANRVLQQINPNGLQIDYTRDAIGRVTDISVTYQGNTQSLLTGRSYRADNLSTGHTLGNGLIDARLYDLQGRLTQQDITGLFTKTYQYDANGNILSQDSIPDPVLKDKYQEDGFAAPSYTYDVLDRIIAENSTLGTLLFTYDENGNRLNKQRNTKDRPYSYNANTNQLTSVNNKAITLDEVGNTLSDKNGKRQYTYNQRNQLHTLTKNGQLRGQYQYNASNQRTSKQHTNKDGTKQRTFHYQYDHFGNLIGEYKENKNGVYKPKRTYVWLNNEPVAQITFRTNQAEEIKHITYITTDHLNTPRIGTDEAAEIAWRWDSDAFGQAQPDKDSDADDANRNIRLRFPGQYKDGESGLYYNWHRYYDPNIGRYITSDPIGLGGGLNTYGYVSANPLINIDPRGLIEWEGSVTTGAGASKILGVMILSADLTTKECIGGFKHRVKVGAVFAGLDLGITRYDGSSGNYTFKDKWSFVFPGASSFNGEAFISSIGGGIGDYGASATIIALGDAISGSASTGDAVGLGFFGSVIGKSNVVSYNKTPCDECEK